MTQSSRGRDDPADALFVRRLFVVLAVGAFAYLVWRLTDVLLLVFGAVVVATILRSLAGLIARWSGLPQRWSVLAAGLAILTGLAGAAYLSGSQLRMQVAQLVALLPSAAEEILKEFGVTNVATELPRALGLGLGGVVSRLASLGVTTVSALTDLFLVIVAGAFLAADPALYRAGVVKVFPPSLHGRIEEALAASGRALELWLVGQLVAMTIIGVLVGLAAWLIGLPSPLALGLIAGLTEFIPFLGPILGALPALVLAATRDLGTLLWTLAALLTIQQVESNLIMPLIQRRTVSLPPVVSLFAVFACGVLLGPTGLILAAPLTVVGYVLVKAFYVRAVLGETTSVPGETQASGPETARSTSP